MVLDQIHQAAVLCIVTCIVIYILALRCFISFSHIEYLLLYSKPLRILRCVPFLFCSKKNPYFPCLVSCLCSKSQKSREQKMIHTRPPLLYLFPTHRISSFLLKSSCPTRHVWRFLFCPKISTDIRCVLFCPPASKDPKDMKQKRMFDTLFSTQV